MHIFALFIEIYSQQLSPPPTSIFILFQLFLSSTWDQIDTFVKQSKITLFHEVEGTQLLFVKQEHLRCKCNNKRLTQHM